MSHTWLDNLRLISEYVFYDDAPALIGVSRSQLARYVKGSATPNKEVQARIAKIAGKMRRRVSQLKRNIKADDARHARRDARATLRLIGRDEIPLPDKLPVFLKSYESGKKGSPVFVYDFRGITATGVQQFFRFMKTVLPQGHFSFTYRMTTAGLSTNKHGMLFSDKLVAQLKMKHNTRNPIAAIFAEVGTAASGAKVEKVLNGYLLHGVRYISTSWEPFCVLSGPGTCLIRSDFEFFEIWHELHNPSARREVLECAITYPRPTEFTDEEKREDIERGADPVTGLRYIWQD